VVVAAAWYDSFAEAGWWGGELSSKSVRPEPVKDADVTRANAVVWFARAEDVIAAVR
jgi:hypothetical protein